LPAGDRLSFDRATAFLLYRNLFEPVERVLQGKNRVYVVAGGTAPGDAATAGLSQLARAFYAGARNLLASHWPVDDEVAERMTVRTLALGPAGTQRAEAFQQAMCEIRADTAHPEWAHPFYWVAVRADGRRGQVKRQRLRGRGAQSRKVAQSN